MLRQKCRLKLGNMNISQQFFMIVIASGTFLALVQGSGFKLQGFIAWDQKFEGTPLPLFFYLY